MDDYVSKPMRRAELIEKLRQWIPVQPAASPGGDTQPPSPRSGQHAQAAA